MTPPLIPFPSSELPHHLLSNAKGEYRKGFDAKKGLEGCELMQMLQYDCTVDEPGRKDGLVRCKEILRLFRRCKDAKGTFMVETTAVEKPPGEG